MKKRLVLALVPMLLLAACGPTSNPTSEPTSTPTVEPTTAPTVEEPVENKTVEFAPMHLYQKMHTLTIRPILSHPETLEEENFEYEIDDDNVAEIDGDRITYVGPGRAMVSYKSKSFEGKFIVFTHEGFATVGGPLYDAYDKLQTRYNNHAQKEGATVFIGDSFFQFWRDGNAGVLFSKDFEGKNVVNLGINGTTTHHWRAMWEFYLKDNLVAPKNIIVNIGINNVDDLSEDGKGAGRNVRALLEEMHETFPETNIYYFSVTRCSSGVFATYWDRHDGVNSYLKENFFTENNEYATYLDANEIFGDDYKDYRMADGLHLNNKGYIVFKSLINQNVEIEELA